MNKIYAWMASKLLGQILGGKKTLVLGWIQTIVGAASIILSLPNIEQLCITAKICLQGNPIYGAVILTLGEITKLLRFATGQAYGDAKFYPPRK